MRGSKTKSLSKHMRGLGLSLSKLMPGPKPTSVAAMWTQAVVRLRRLGPLLRLVAVLEWRRRLSVEFLQSSQRRRRPPSLHGAGRRPHLPARPARLTGRLQSTLAADVRLGGRVSEAARHRVGGVHSCCTAAVEPTTDPLNGRQSLAAAAAAARHKHVPMFVFAAENRAPAAMLLAALPLDLRLRSDGIVMNNQTTSVCRKAIY